MGAIVSKVRLGAGCGLYDEVGEGVLSLCYTVEYKTSRRARRLHVTASEGQHGLLAVVQDVCKVNDIVEKIIFN